MSRVSTTAFVHLDRRESAQIYVLHEGDPQGTMICYGDLRIDPLRFVVNYIPGDLAELRRKERRSNGYDEYADNLLYPSPMALLDDVRQVVQWFQSGTIIGKQRNDIHGLFWRNVRQRLSASRFYSEKLNPTALCPLPSPVLDSICYW